MEKDIIFHYITSNQNPADLATRSLTVPEIRKCSLWWHGPSWLEQEESSWPAWNISDITPEVLEQVQSEAKGPKTSIEMTMSIMAGVSDKDQKEMMSLFGMNENHFSSLRKLLRVSVYVMKFLKIKVWNQLSIDDQRCFRHHKLLVMVFDSLKETKSISSQEIKLLSLLWVSCIQHRRYNDVYIAIKNKRKHCLQRQLGLNIDEFDILRCYGRYLHAELTKETKYPKLLARHELTLLYKKFITV